MISLSEKVQNFLLHHRTRVNELVNRQSFPGFSVQTAVETGLQWIQAMVNAGLEPDLWPLEVALDAAVRGLLPRIEGLVERIENWIEVYTNALRKGGPNLLIDWIHLLLRLQDKPEIRKKLLPWLDSWKDAYLDDREWRECLGVLWWFAGGVALRPRAVELFTQFKPELQVQLIELACPDWSVSEVIALQDRPLGTRPWARLAGGPAGLGGPWCEPPVLLKRQGNPLVSSATKSWEILADAFGVEVVPLNAADETMKENLPRSQSWNYQAQKITSPSGVSYPFPWGRPLVALKGVEYPDGLAALVSKDLLSVLLLYRGGA